MRVERHGHLGTEAKKIFLVRRSTLRRRKRFLAFDVRGIVQSIWCVQFNRIRAPFCRTKPSINHVYQTIFSILFAFFPVRDSIPFEIQTSDRRHLLLRSSFGPGWLLVVGGEVPLLKQSPRPENSNSNVTLSYINHFAISKSAPWESQDFRLKNSYDRFKETADKLSYAQVGGEILLEQICLNRTETQKVDFFCSERSDSQFETFGWERRGVELIFFVFSKVNCFRDRGEKKRESSRIQTGSISLLTSVCRSAVICFDLLD